MAGKLAVWPHLFANKFQPDFDFGAIACWYEAMHNRTHNPVEAELAMASLNRELYEDLPHVGIRNLRGTVWHNSAYTKLKKTQKWSHQANLGSLPAIQKQFETAKSA